MKISNATRLAFVLIVAMCLTSRLDSAGASLVEPVRQSSNQEARFVEGAPIVGYPQAVDNYLYSPQKMRNLAHKLTVSIWDEHQWTCFDYIITAESRWNVNADNPHSTAYGLGQILNSYKRTKGNGLRQLEAAYNYILHRYTTPCEAYAWHKKHGWY